MTGKPDGAFLIRDRNASDLVLSVNFKSKYLLACLLAVSSFPWPVHKPSLHARVSSLSPPYNCCGILAGKPTHHLLANDGGTWMLNKKTYGDATSVQSVSMPGILHAC